MPGRRIPSRGTSAPSVHPARPRRLRRTARLRDLVAETTVEARRLIYPVFVRTGGGDPTPIPSMPGIDRFPIRHLARLARTLETEGVRSVLLFGVGRAKDAEGTDAWSPTGVIPEAVRALRKETPDLVISTDVCLCAYTTHGHCGVMKNGSVENDVTCERLGRIAVAHARAGADMVAPSAMMDGQTGEVRRALDEAGHPETAIMAYSTKHASAFYGPFREAEESTPSFGDRRGYQLDPRNGREAMREMDLDLAEGADVLMVKPALTSLDLLSRARGRYSVPLAAFQVSGEYSMLKAASARGVLDERAAVEESLVAIRRAGADLLITYFARDAARWFREGP